MPTAIQHLDYSAVARSRTSGAPGRNSQVGGLALLIAWAVIMLMVAIVAPSGPEATAMDPFQLLASF